MRVGNTVHLNHQFDTFLTEIAGMKSSFGRSCYRFDPQKRVSSKAGRNAGACHPTTCNMRMRSGCSQEAKQTIRFLIAVTL